MTNIKWLAWVEIIVYFVGNLFATMVTSNLSLFVEGGGIGTPADSGNALSLQMAGAALGAFGYGWLKKNLGHNVIPLAWLVMGAGFLVVAHSSSLVAVMAGMFVAGMGVGVVWPAYCMRVTELTKPVAQAMAIAVAGALQGFGNFFNPVVGGWLAGLFGIGYGADMIRLDSWVIVAIAVVVFLAGTFGVRRAKQRVKG